MRCGPFYSDWRTEGHILVPLPKLSEAYGCTGFAVFAAYEPQAYKITKGEITKFDSSPGKTRRGFCARCGSTLTCESLPVITLTHFHVGAFDQAARLQPKKQYFVEERVPWLHIGDAEDTSVH